jgi:hypothetical protein
MVSDETFYLSAAAAMSARHDSEAGTIAPLAANEDDDARSLLLLPLQRDQKPRAAVVPLSGELYGKYFSYGIANRDDNVAPHHILVERKCSHSDNVLLA